VRPRNARISGGRKRRHIVDSASSRRSSGERKRVKTRRCGNGTGKNRKRACGNERMTSANDKRRKLGDEARSTLFLQRCSILTQSSECRQTPARRTSLPLIKRPK
jgi:hypothetical protein